MGKKTNTIIGTDKCKYEELRIVKISCLPFLDCGFKSVLLGLRRSRCAASAMSGSEFCVCVRRGTEFSSYARAAPLALRCERYFWK